MNTPAAVSLALLLLLPAAAAEAQPRRPARSPAPQGEAPTQEAERAYHSGDFERAERLSSDILRRNPQDHVALYLRASARAELGPARGDVRLLREGIADAREAIRLGGSRNTVYYLPYLYGMTRLAQVENRAEHAETAVQVADQILGQPRIGDEDRANLLYQRALARVFLGDVDNAVADYRQAIQVNDAHLGAWVGLAEAYATAGEDAQALDTFNQIVRAFPDNPLVYNNRGMFRQQQGQIEEAIADFTRALELDRRFVVAYVNRAFALLETGDPEAAEADLTEALRVNPGQPLAYGMRATARLAQGKLQPAISDHARVVEMEPGNPVAHADLALVRFLGEDYAGALRSFEQATRLDPHLHDLHPWRFLTMERAGRAQDAQSRFRTVLQREPAERDWPEQLVAYLAGEMSEAELLEWADDGDPQTVRVQQCEAHFFIGQRRLQAGDSEAAAEHFQKALDTGAEQLAAYRAAEFARSRLGD